MSAVDDMITALTATIDHANPSPPPDRLAGTASRGEQVPVSAMIDAIRAANNRALGAFGSLSAAAAAANLALSLTAQAQADWTTSSAAAFAAWDRAVRALETLILAANHSAPVDPTIHLDSGKVPAAKQRTGAAVALARTLTVSAEARDSAMRAMAAYLVFYAGMPPGPDRDASGALASAQSGRQAAQVELAAVMQRAQNYLNYLGVA